MTIRSKIAPLLDSVGFLDAASFLLRPVRDGRLTILTYHRISVPGTHPHLDDGVISCMPEEFEEQMQWLSKVATPIGFGDLAAIEDGKSALPPKAVIVTFDDGYLDNYLYAFPILRKLKIPATIFLATGFVGTRNPFWWDVAVYALEVSGVGEGRATEELERLKRLPEAERRKLVAGYLRAAHVDPEAFPRSIVSWEEVKEMAENGIEFGGHTVTHPVLSTVTPELLEAEVSGCAEAIRERLGRAPLAFAYPVGRSFAVNDAAVEVVRSAGFRYAVTTEYGRNRQDRMDRMRLRRIGISLHDSMSRFKGKWIASRFFGSS